MTCKNLLYDLCKLDMMPCDYRTNPFYDDHRKDYCRNNDQKEVIALNKHSDSCP